MDCDILVVGAGIAGCTAALLYARAGLSVMVIEKKKKKEDYKRLCTHFIQPSALPVIRRLGLDTAIEKAGGLRNKADIWTGGGWIRSDKAYSDDPAMSHGYNIERRLLDPLLRDALESQPGIRYYAGVEVLRIEQTGEQSEAVCVDTAAKEIRYRTRLVVAADGRFSPLANVLGNTGQFTLNNRFACFAYFRDIPLQPNGHSLFWMLNPNMAFAYPLHDGITLLCLFIRKSEWPAWKQNMESMLLDLIAQLPDGPDISNAKRISPIRKMMEMTNVSRSALQHGVAFIGDAALALDPMSGVGCGFAFQSASWLVDHTTTALTLGQDLEPALQAYANYHRRQLGPHAAGIIAESFAEPDSLQKTLLFSQVVKDPELTDSFLALTGRLITPQHFQLLYLKKNLANTTGREKV